MTHEEAVAAVRRGERVTNKFSIHDSAKGTCPGFNHRWRTLSCDNETDVVECADCGRQDVVKCNFDDEYA